MAPGPASPYRPEFEAALRLFARASAQMVERGYGAPVLVGGAAVELYTLGSVVTGDFDISTPRPAEFEAILRLLGFSKPEGLGHTPLGWVHPALRLGFEVVTATLLDGMADRERVRLVDLDVDGEAAFISMEDMIADRMGQFASGSAPDMRAQAQKLFDLYPDADQDYLDGRIRYETGGDFGIADLRS